MYAQNKSYIITNLFICAEPSFLQINFQIKWTKTAWHTFEWKKTIILQEQVSCISVFDLFSIFRKGGRWCVGISGPSCPSIRRETGLDPAGVYGGWFEEGSPGGQLELSVRRPHFHVPIHCWHKQETSWPQRCGHHHGGNERLAILQVLCESQTAQKSHREAPEQPTG